MRRHLVAVNDLVVCGRALELMLKTLGFGASAHRKMKKSLVLVPVSTKALVCGCFRSFSLLG